MDKAEKLPLLDRFLAYFWPTLALKRQRARLQLRFLAAASPSHNWGWRPYSEASLQETIAQEIPIVRKRVKELVMNFPAFAHIADMMAALVVGTGIKFRSKAKNAKGEVDSALSAQIESILSWALEELDVTGKFHGYELMRMAKREMIRSGEFLFIKTSDRDPKRCVPYCLLMVDPVELSSIPANGMRKGAEFLDGIEYDPATHRIIAYHFSNITKPKRIMANNILHGFSPLFPRQMRGISILAPAVLLANDLDDYITAELQVTKMASKYLAFIESEDIAAFQQARLKDQTVTQKELEEFENAILEYLKPGEKVTLASPQRPSSNFSPFVNFLLRMISLASNLPYEFVSGDYSNVNYTSLRAIKATYMSFIRVQQLEMIQRFCQPVVRDLITEAYLNKRLNLSGYAENPRRFWEGTFLVPGSEPIDPVRETRADIEQIKVGLKSPQEIAAARGRDFDDILQELQEAKNQMSEKGFDLFSMLTTV